MLQWLIYLIFILRFEFSKNAEIEFLITKVPKYYTPLNEDIYISGSFNNWSQKNDAYKLTRLTNSLNNQQFKIKLNLKNSKYEYKFTRGSLETNERVMSNRILNINNDQKQLIKVNISNWDDMISNMQDDEHTAVGHTYILHSEFPYRQFNTTKTIRIYLPTDYFTSQKSYSVLYMTDGQQLFDNFKSYNLGELQIDETLENFYTHGKSTSIVVGMDTPFSFDDNIRLDELSPYLRDELRPARDGGGGGKADLFLNFLINNLKPYIDQKFRTKPQREFTGIMGTTFGALFAFYGGLKYENIFSKIGVFSPSFYFNHKINEFASNKNLIKFNNTKIYFTCGGQEDTENEMLNTMFEVIDRLEMSGFGKNIKYSVKSDGTRENWFWAREFPNAYSWLFNL